MLKYVETYNEFQRPVTVFECLNSNELQMLNMTFKVFSIFISTYFKFSTQFGNFGFKNAEIHT
jgi:hypothetical protein